MAGHGQGFDVAAWASSKLQGEWSAQHFSSQLTPERLRGLLDSFAAMDSMVKVGGCDGSIAQGLARRVALCVAAPLQLVCRVGCHGAGAGAPAPGGRWVLRPALLGSSLPPRGLGRWW